MTQRKTEAAAVAAGNAVPVEQNAALEFEPVDDNEFVRHKVARGRSVEDHSGRLKLPGELAKVRAGREAARLIELGFLIGPDGETAIPTGPRANFDAA